jgi:XTP/dITP diphosphohydrolase
MNRPRPQLLVLGTSNRKKRDELAALLAPLGIELRSLAEYHQAITVVEDGTTFAANAAKKASQQAQHLREWVIGEDSGLCVDALNGAPGIFSARFSGDNATDESNNLKLLHELRDVPLERRTAHYVCHMALSDPDGVLRITCEDTCHGRIALAPAGSAGFGYDPLFEIVERQKTFGQLGELVKSRISHRARATRRFLDALREL